VGNGSVLLALWLHSPVGNGSVPLALWLHSPVGWLLRTGMSSGTRRSF